VFTIVGVVGDVHWERIEDGYVPLVYFPILRDEVKPTSMAEFATATTLLLVVTVIATLIPARRAARTHPVVALRGE
jgi:ABC-type lipoprotein release transport system permease subunit